MGEHLAGSIIADHDEKKSGSVEKMEVVVEGKIPACTPSSPLLQSVS